CACCSSSTGRARRASSGSAEQLVRPGSAGLCSDWRRRCPMSAFDRSEMDGYEALVSELRANPPVAPERLRQRVLESAPVPRRQRSRKRKLVLVVVPLAVVLAVGAALVHGFVSSGSHVNAASVPVLRQNQRPSLQQTLKRGGGSGSATTAATAAHEGVPKALQSYSPVHGAGQNDAL